MRTIFLITSFTALIMTCGTSLFAADSPITPTHTKEQMTDLVAKLYDAPTSKFLSKELNGPDGKGVRVVFVQNGTRYTLDVDWYATGIAIWQRPEGTIHPNPKAYAYGDSQADGVIDDGVGHPTLPDFRIGGEIAKDLGIKNPEYRSRWQVVYEKALADLEATLRK